MEVMRGEWGRRGDLAVVAGHSGVPLLDDWGGRRPGSYVGKMTPRSTAMVLDVCVGRDTWAPVGLKLLTREGLVGWANAASIHVHRG